MSNKYGKTMLLAVIAVVMMAGTVQAQSIWMNAVGASAQWKTWGYAAIFALPQPTKHFTVKNLGGVDDQRGAGVPIQKGDIWIVWSGPDNAPTDVAAYVSVDSTVGIRAMYSAPTAKIWLDPSIGAAAPANLLTGFADETLLPAAVISALTGRTFTNAFSEIRPEDAKYATARMFDLGYGASPIGADVKSGVSTKKVQAIDFNVTGKDPITQNDVRTDLRVRYIGAAPILAFVNNNNAGAGHFGQRDGSGAPVFTNVRRAQLAGFADGSFSRTMDLLEDYSIPSVTVKTYIREPLSGTYNNFEYNVPAIAGIGSSQENGITLPGDNPLSYKPAAGGGSRTRVVGSGEMVSTVLANDDSLGYCFWGYGNFGSAYLKSHYLKVDGIDPLLNDYHTYGWYPEPADVTMTNVKNGTYPVWGIYHAVYAADIEGYVDWIQLVSESILPYLPEYVPFTEMKVFRSHYTQLSSGDIATGTYAAPHNGNVPAIPSAGGNVGGKIYPKRADIDYFTFTGMELLERRE